jgi:hypothetical protein
MCPFGPVMSHAMSSPLTTSPPFVTVAQTM